MGNCLGTEIDLQLSGCGCRHSQNGLQGHNSDLVVDAMPCAKQPLVSDGLAGLVASISLYLDLSCIDELDGGAAHRGRNFQVEWIGSAFPTLERATGWQTWWIDHQ